MADSIFVRVQRVLSTGVEGATEALERASGASLMREAIREVERAVADIRLEQDAVLMRRLQAEQQQKQARARLATLDEQARFALGKGREDLAAAAVSQQIETEALLERLKTLLTETADEGRRLEDGLAALKARKTQMDRELAAFAAAQRAAAAEGAGPAPVARAQRRAERAEAAFERAMAASGGAGGTLANSGDAAKLAEVDALRRDETIAERLAALKAGGGKAAAGKKRSRAS